MDPAPMTHPLHITLIAAGSADPVLALVVGGTVAVAFLAPILALISWLRGRP
jgi:hypothetical protein